MENFKEIYKNQVNLLLDVLPIVSEQECFALKGGTAINFFIRNMPRLSVDIDLTYINIETREYTLKNITNSLKNIKNKIFKMIPNAKFFEQNYEEHIIKLVVKTTKADIKIEPNTILRGTLYPIQHMDIAQNLELFFQKAILDVPVLSFEEIYAGKICAALDRQHPRDLFDIRGLYENEGLTNKIINAFIIYLTSAPRPMHELLSPNIQNLENLYKTEFLGMTNEKVEYDELISYLYKLIRDIKSKLTDKQKQFLISIKNNKPDFTLMPFDNIDQLPAVKWKIHNISKMDDTKRNLMLIKLKEALDIKS